MINKLFFLVKDFRDSFGIQADVGANH